MKRCPQCGREYDLSMSYCLDDGAELLYGPASADEPATAILHETAPPAEAQTRAQIHTTDHTGVLPAGIRVDPPKRFEKRLLLGSLCLAVIVLGAFFAYRYLAPTRQIESIAVMPFVNESGNAEVEYLSDGMTETLISSLSQLPNLNVKARSSVFRYKGKDTSSQIIGKELNVQAILNGRVVQRAQDLILYVELVDAATENSLWKQTYTKTMSSLVAMQNDVARDVADKLRVKLSVTDEQKLVKNYTENTAAYQAYLRGRHIWNKGPVPGYEKSRDYFQQAIEIDPAYALAYSGLADFYGFSAANELSSPEESWAKCESAVNKALELDDTLAETYNPLAAVKLYLYRDWPAAERAFRRGIELNPNFPEIRHHFALRLVGFGRGDEGLAEIQRALDLDPLSVRFNLTRARLLFLMREYDRSLDQMRKTLELDPNAPLAHEWLGNIYERKNMQKEAVAAWTQALSLRGQSEKAAALEHSFASSGFEAAIRSLARKEIEQLDEKRKRGDYAPAAEYMIAYTRLGDVEQALYWFARVEDDRTGFRFEVDANPIFDSLRGEARFQELVKKVGNSK